MSPEPIPKRWYLASPAPPEHMARFPQLSPIIVQLLYNRGITDPASVHTFLNGSNDTNPFKLPGLPDAITRLRQALRAGERIVVYGDFDTDGVTATALLVQTLRALGGRVKPYIPHRVDEGYGLHKSALTRIARLGASVVVTVDCGVRSVDEVQHANQLGLDMIITDHHSIGPTLPPAYAIVNPKLPGTPPPAMNLAGVGVAFKLAQGLLRSHQRTPVTRSTVRLNEEDLLDLVALGTVADLVPLVGENRSLVSRGLERLNRMERPGVEALCRWSSIGPGGVDVNAISYALAPRLNAAGRIAHAKIAYQLLETDYPAEAELRARELDRLNRERRQWTTEAHEQARELALARSNGGRLLFAAAPDFKSGIVGLVASRLVDEFYLPAVIAEIGEPFSRGSARSIPEFHITRALDKCADLLVRYGGHAAAAGFTVRTESLERLAEQLQHYALQALGDQELCPTLHIDAEIPLAQLSGPFHRILQQLEPCGYANPAPLFLSRNVKLLYHKNVGSDGQHLKLTVSDGQAVWDAIAFRQGHWAGRLPDAIDAVYHLEVNEWNGERRLQLNIQDLRPAGQGNRIQNM